MLPLSSLCDGTNKRYGQRARQLSDRIADAQAAWPGLELGAEEFAAYLAERGGVEEELCDVDLYLAAACAKGDKAAIAAFDARYMKHIGAAVAPMRLAPEMVDDVAQELRRKLLVRDGNELPRIADYSGRADLRTWIRTAAVRTAIDLVRKQRDTPMEDDVLAAAMPALDDDPALLHARQLYKAELKAAFADAITQLEPRERTLLKYHYVDGLSIDRIGAIYGVHRATAARWTSLARDQLGRIVHRTLRAKLAVSPTELASIARLVESHIDLSVRRILS